MKQPVWSSGPDYAEPQMKKNIYCQTSFLMPLLSSRCCQKRDDYYYYYYYYSPRAFLLHGFSASKQFLLFSRRESIEKLQFMRMPVFLLYYIIDEFIHQRTRKETYIRDICKERSSSRKSKSAACRGKPHRTNNSHFPMQQKCLKMPAQRDIISFWDEMVRRCLLPAYMPDER